LPCPPLIATMSNANDGVIREKVTEEMRLAAKGLALLEAQEAAHVVKIETDLQAAEAFKAGSDVKIEELETQIDDLPGKDNMKARNAISREAAAYKNDSKYIDAVKVIKGLNPPNGHFITNQIGGVQKAQAESATDAAPAGADKKNDKAKKEKKAGDTAGISPAERDELEKLKKDIIARKCELKDQGMSGG